MEGFYVVTLESDAGEVDFFTSATDKFDTITVEHMTKIDMNGPAKFEGVNVENTKLQVDHFSFPDGHGVIVLISGRLLDLGCVAGHPAVVMPGSFTNLLAQLALLEELEENQSLQE